MQKSTSDTSTAPTLRTIAIQMKKRLEVVGTTNVTLKRGLRLILKKENGSYKLLCARENTLPSSAEIAIAGNTFFGKRNWMFGKAKTNLVNEGYVIVPKTGVR